MIEFASAHKMATTRGPHWIDYSKKIDDISTQQLDEEFYDAEEKNVYPWEAYSRLSPSGESLNLLVSDELCKRMKEENVIATIFYAMSLNAPLLFALGQQLPKSYLCDVDMDDIFNFLKEQEIHPSDPRYRDENYSLNQSAAYNTAAKEIVWRLVKSPECHRRLESYLKSVKEFLDESPEGQKHGEMRAKLSAWLKLLAPRLVNTL